MAAILRIVISEIIESRAAISSRKADKVYEAVSRELQGGNSVELSFEGVERILSSFLNAAVGRLYGEFKEIELRKALNYTDIPEHVAPLLDRTIENAKRFFAAPEVYRQVYEELSLA